MSERSRVAVWLNGSFGSGKSTLAKALVATDQRWRIFDPEYVGFMLAPQFPECEITDFQDLRSWRRLVPIVAHELAEETGQPLLIVQTVLNQRYWLEIADSIRGQGYSLHHVLLDVHPDALDERITADRDLPAAAEWRRQHIPAFVDARREWLAYAADLVIDTTSISAPQAAGQLADALASWTASTPAAAPILTDAHRMVVLRGHRAEDIPAIVEQCHDRAMLEYTRIPRPYNLEHAHQLLDLARSSWAQPCAVSPRFWAITTRCEEGEYAFAGTIDYRPTGHGTAEVGYGLHPAFRGAGLMSIALGLVLDHAFEHDGQHLMAWQAAVGNWASTKTAWRNGFRFEGRVRGLCLRPDGGFSDGWIATLHRDDPRTPTRPWSETIDVLGAADLR
ncbi:GNAT family N-acetyltransferase [Nocardia sp. NPDC049707]|uniref:GNAT family N-acetyltransferase n=1 Tax=Nocardia sp. NPDC049707 TaxID=3154735 RepID=UPI0034156381